MRVMGSVGVLTQGRLPPEPRFTLPPCSRTGPRGRERGSTLRGRGPQTQEQLLLTRQEREQQILSTCWAPSISLQSSQGPPVPTSPTLPWPRSFANPPAASGWRKVPGGNPRLRNRLEGQGGRWSPGLWADQWPRNRGSKRLRYFLLPKTWAWCSPPPQSPCLEQQLPRPSSGTEG